MTTFDTLEKKHDRLLPHLGSREPKSRNLTPARWGISIRVGRCEGANLENAAERFCGTRRRTTHYGR